ncbi:hypothetical protein Csa_011856 [Cucumis sativus]|uniref:Uncharacterized protein n=1 Tax=Cucumis sativus TaxID=3659 RepID=A0A0A0K323_CUCSA|nr:hypothetical protein Csa_011856 [Cucumis sativus]
MECETKVEEEATKEFEKESNKNTMLEEKMPNGKKEGGQVYAKMLLRAQVEKRRKGKLGSRHHPYGEEEEVLGPKRRQPFKAEEFNDILSYAHRLVLYVIRKALQGQTPQTSRSSTSPTSPTYNSSKKTLLAYFESK